MRKIVAALSLLVLAGPTASLRSQGAPFDLSVRNIMRGPQLYGREPQQVRWTADGEWIYFQWLEAGAAWNETLKPFRVAPRAGATPERVSAAHLDTVAPMLATGPRSRDGRMRVVAAGGGLWIHQIEDHGFSRPSSWHDEYRRILELFDRTIGPGGSKAPR